MAGRRNDYLEPRTDVPALRDWSTELILTEAVSGIRGAVAFAVVSPAVAVALLVWLPADPGTVAAAVVLILFGLLVGAGTAAARSETAPRRRGLLDGPWRRCAAAVAVREDGDVQDRLIVSLPEGEALVVGGSLDPFPRVVDHRQEVFLCGPDGEGRAVLRVAGLLRMLPARVDPRPARPREPQPLVPGGRPLDDPGVAGAYRGFRWGTRLWLYPTVLGAFGLALVALALRPLAVAGLVVGGLLLAVAACAVPTVVSFSRWYAEALSGLHAAREWSPVPVTMLPWGPGQPVAGLAQLPGGIALVRFPYPQPDVVANVSDTGTLWMAGGGTGAVAVGVPGIPVLTFCLVSPDSDAPVEEPPPWLLHTDDPVLDSSLRR